MTSKHTPGPWTACFSSLNGINISFEITASPHGSLRPLVGCSWPWNVGEAETETLTANAHLIAAAPELAEALEAALKMLPIGFAPTGRPGGADDRNAALDAVRKMGIEALAKARGEPS